MKLLLLLLLHTSLTKVPFFFTVYNFYPILCKRFQINVIFCRANSPVCRMKMKNDAISTCNKKREEKFSLSLRLSPLLLICNTGAEL